MIQTAQKLLAAKRMGSQRRNHFLNFAGNHILGDKIGIIKNLAKNPLGQQMLNQHFFDCPH